jgi:anaerobic magnesium-protoporphyrin IX monomethyl ester cyclase
MKILFANPAYRVDLNNGFERYFFCAGSRCPWSLVKGPNELPRYSMFPFFMAYSAALLEQHGYEVDAIDSSALNQSEEDFIDYCIQSNPDVILLEPATTSINYIIDLSRTLTLRTNSLILFAGPHATIYAEEILINHRHITAIILGEYEFTLLEYIQSLSVKKQIEKIDGIAFRSDLDQLIINPKTIYQNLNLLPFPARNIFPSKTEANLKYYHDGFCQNKPAIQMHSSRGCPFRCNFCLWTQTIYKPGQYRTFSPERVVREMKEVIDIYGAKEIYFDDDTFTARKKHVLAICNEIMKEGIKIPWSVMGDAMCADEDMIYAMKTAGCVGIKFGLESASEEILKNINKPIKTFKLKRLLKICRRLRIKTHVTVSLVHIGETEDTINLTMRFVSKLDVDSIQFSIATPYPGTKFYDDVRSQGMLLKTNWEDYDPTHNPIVKHPGVSFEFLKQTEAKAHGWWLRKKLLNPVWTIYQVYFLFYLLRNQGINGFFSRIRRAISIIFSTQFK